MRSVGSVAGQRARTGRIRAMTAAPTIPADPAASVRVRRIQRLKLLAILLVCAAPVIASYLVYYVFPPMGRTNFGTLIEPQRPTSDLRLTALDGKPQTLAPLLGQWLLVQVHSADCDKACADKLYSLRQYRTMTGKDRERIDRVWLITGSGTPDESLSREYAGTVMLRADAAALAARFPVEPGRRPEDYLYVIDPMGNLMLRFVADGDPARIRKDIGRLLRASRVG